MSNTSKPKSRILNAVHESAHDLHRLGFIDKRNSGAGALDYARRAESDGQVVLIGLSGNGVLDLPAYSSYVSADR